MSKYVLRWQYGVFAGETKTHYTYGSLDMLKYKAEELAKNDKVTYITIDEVREVIKDIRPNGLGKRLYLCNEHKEKLIDLLLPF